MSERLPYDNGQQTVEADASRYLESFFNEATWAAETLDGYMLTEFGLKFDGSELYGADGSALGEISIKGIEQAESIAVSRPNLLFELRRRQQERLEYLDMLAMCRGDLPNTMIVVSDFPPELMDAGQDVGGYNVARKQSMVRVIIRGQTGNLRLISQSLDQSDRGGLEAIYALFGRTPEAGELLGQRIHAQLSQQQQETVVSDVRQAYDISLEKGRPGQRFYAGRAWGDQQAETYKFVIGQAAFVDAFIQMLDQADNSEIDKLRYGFAAAMAERYEQRLTSTSSGNYLNPQSYLMEMEDAGSRAGRQGRVFSGCGSTMAKLEDQLEAAGYGNKTSEKTDYSFDKKMYCVVCQKEPKHNEPKKMCGPCGICQKCDKQLSSKSLSKQ
jgi:hypothetical protein